jgi:hypothetical protein
MNNTDNQYMDLIGDAYKNYISKASMSNDKDCLVRQKEGSYLKEMRLFTQEEFINKIKTDDEFTKKWGVKVEVRELSLDERYVLANINGSKEKLPGEPNYTEEQQHSMLDELVPTKAISLTYDNRTEVIYE